MFLNDLYTITNIQPSAEGFLATIKLNPEHLIYKAHFPGNPITPGVCILQIGLELIARHVEQKLTMFSSKNIKFLQILSPLENALVNFNITLKKSKEKIYDATILVENGNGVFCKISSSYQVEK